MNEFIFTVPYLGFNHKRTRLTMTRTALAPWSFYNSSLNRHHSLICPIIYAWGNTVLNYHFKSSSLPCVLYSVSALMWTFYWRNHTLYRIQMISLYKHQYSGHSKDRQYIFWKLGKEKENDKEAWLGTQITEALCWSPLNPLQSIKKKC